MWSYGSHIILFLNFWHIILNIWRSGEALREWMWPSLSLLNILYNPVVNICIHKQRNIFISKRKSNLTPGILKCSQTIMPASFSSHYLISQVFFGQEMNSKIIQCYRQLIPTPIQWKMNFFSWISQVANTDRTRNRTVCDRIKT